MIPTIHIGGGLFQDPNFAQRVADRWQELRKTIWSTEKVLADIDAAVAMLSDGNPNLEKPAAGEPSNPIARNFTRWTTGGYGTGIYHWPNCFFGARLSGIAVAAEHVAERAAQ